MLVYKSKDNKFLVYMGGLENLPCSWTQSTKIGDGKYNICALLPVLPSLRYGYNWSHMVQPCFIIYYYRRSVPKHLSYLPF